MNLEYFRKFSNHEEKQNNNKNVWLYTRVSSKEQFDNNSSIDNQTIAAENYAAENNYDISNTFGGTYESAKGDFSRKEFTRFFNELIKAKQKPFAVMIYKMSRFSRTGATAIGLVSKLINEHNVHLIEVSTGKDSTTPRGELEIIESLQYARKENIERLEVTVPGMKTFVKNGNWLGKAPRGYDHYGPRVKNLKFVSGKQRLEINTEGKILKKAWKWKLQEIPDFEILKKLELRGLEISKQSLSATWRNPFYCGININKLLEGNVVNGNWTPIVSQKDFETINNRFDASNNSGYKQSKYNINRPLQSQLFCGICDTKMTGYVKKQTIHYYKCQNKKCTCKDLNANSSKKSLNTGLNNLFQEYLEQFNLSPSMENVFREQMKITIKDRSKDEIDIEHSLNKRIINANQSLDKLERKYIFEDIGTGTYQKFKFELEDEITKLEHEKSKLSLEISNLNKKIDKCIEITKNISGYWAYESIDNKVKLQKLIFPLGIIIDPLKRQYRTTKVNSVFSTISSITRNREDKTKSAPSDLDDASCSVAGAGLEPANFGL